ncbi:MULTISPECIES: hypothetical protein [Cupriavidus]|jgi:Spy/CpxP family protein refolding chaperone|uniref:hypothetical protein n=1 Tax=Cupriavidus sp. KB_39 TaxID=3233036 RepID=UPI003F8DEB16
MLTRPHLRLLVAGTLALSGLIGSIAASHAQVAFWHTARAEQSARVNRVAGGWEMASVRAESRDHVRAQIERMEQRARNDDRLSGRPPGAPGRDEDRPVRQTSDRSSVNDNPGRSNDMRPSGMGPGWQARSRDGGR